MSAILRLAWSDLLHDRLRTLFSALGIAVVVMSTLLLNSFTRSMSLFLDAAPVSTNLLLVDAHFIDPSESVISAEAIAELKSWTLGPVRRVSPLMFRQVRIDNRITPLRATEPEDWGTVYNMRLVEGSWPTGLDQVIVGEGSAVANGWRVGRQLPIFGESFQISGIYRAPGTGFSAVWMSMDAALHLFGPERSIQILTLELAPGEDPEKIAQDLQSAPAIAGKYTLFLEDSYTRRDGQVVRDIYSVVRLVSLIVLLAVPLSTYTITLLSLAERMRPLGILRAVGFTQGHIRWFLLLRSTALACLAFALGLGIALIYLGIRSSSGPLYVLGVPFELALSVEQMVSMMGITLAFALLGAWLSSLRPLRVAVNDLLRD